MTPEEYRAVMLQSPQFLYFGIKPVWSPGSMDIQAFCHDEVVRQFHDPRVREDGGVRVEWMMRAWTYAFEHEEDLIDPAHIKIIGTCVEPKYNSGFHIRSDTGFRRENVYIGNRKGADPLVIGEFIHALTDQVQRVVPGPADMKLFHGYQPENFRDAVQGIRTIDDWYLAFEWIHPFMDGNGRSGKILYNWLSGTLLQPILISDYFGGWNP